MGSTQELQRSFVGGEMAPRMFGRPDDVRFQHGAAKLQNLIPLPQGPAQKRPGFEFVREVRNSANATFLLPFTFSQDDTLVIEMGRDTIDARSIGYFRFHTNGATVFYQLPRDYDAPQTATAITTTPGVFTVASHTFTTGDPVVLTMYPTGDICTFTTADDRVNGLVVTPAEGSQIMFVGSAGGVPPDEIEEQRIYYARNVVAGTCQLSLTRDGNIIPLATTHAGTVFAAFPPSQLVGSADGPIDVRKTYYVINASGTTLQLANTRLDALNGVPLPMSAVGSGNANNDIRIHYDDRVGDLVNFANTCWYCFRRPNTGIDSTIMTLLDHTGHPPSNINFWMRQVGGDNAVVTFSTVTEQADWGAAHGFTEGTPVIFSNVGGALPTGDNGVDPAAPLTGGAIYYIRNPTGNFFQLSETLGGVVLDLTAAGSGTTTALVNSIFEVPHFFELAEIPNVRYAQSNDVLSLVHPNRPPLELKRLGSTHWVSEDIPFNDGIPPMDVTATPTRGLGWVISSMTAASPAVLTLNRTHGLTAETRVVVTGAGDIPDGDYVVWAPSVATMQLVDLQHVQVNSTSAVLGDNPSVQEVVAGAEVDETYVVTAIDFGGQESAASSEFTVSNNLLVEGASNAVTWGSVAGSERYRVYKKEIGAFGFIGEVLATQPLTFKDDGLNPDLDITPPIVDDSIRRTKVVTFDSANDAVLWAGHGLEEGDPVIFQSSDALPTAITDYTTYYVRNPVGDSFGVATTPGGVILAMTGANTAERHEAVAGLFPASVAYFEQRRVFAGSLTKRQRVWMTASATEDDLSYSIPTVASDRIKFDVAAREAGAIRHVVPLSHLMILSSTTEYRVTPINDDAITPESISVRPQSFVGTNNAQPAIVNNVGIFAADRGGHVREMGFSQDVISYLTGDLSLRSTHLFDGFTIEQIAYSKAPNPLLWFVSSSGKLLGLTYVPEEQIGAWSQHITAGTFESCASVAEGIDDHLYVIAARNIDGNAVRYVERMGHNHGTEAIEDVFAVDGGASYSGPAATVITGLIHLANEPVAVLADGLVVEGLEVSATGTLTLAVAAAKVHVGLAYTAELQTLPVIMNQTKASGRGITKNVNAVRVRLEDSGDFTMGPDTAHLTDSQLPAAGALLSEAIDITVAGSWTQDGQVTLRQTKPLPLTVVSMTYEIASGG